MKRALACLALLTFSTGFSTASPIQETAAEKAVERAAEPPSEGEHGGLELWKWANFAILAGVLGYLVAKNAGPFFVARTRQIRKDMIEAEELRKRAEARAAEVDRRLANLESDIAALRAESQRETQSESERLSKYTVTEIAKLQAHAQKEIVAAGKAARLDLKRHSAKLAIALAEEKIRARMGPATQDVLIQNFVRQIDPPSAAGMS
jgi:F-type H+-transporting ATPase subunit b